MQPKDDIPFFQTPTRFTFSPTQLQILQDALGDVKNIDSKKERHRMIKTVRNRILELPESKTLDTKGRDDIRAAIDSWFSLRAKRQTNKIKFGKSWTARLVLYEQNKEQVQVTQAKLFAKAEEKGENPNRHFDFLQRAISKLWKRQSKADRKALERLAKKWNKEGAPRAQKQTAANKNTWNYTKKFAEDMYNSLGVRFVFLVALETPDGLVKTGMMDFNDSLGGGATYMSKHANWKMEGIDIESWMHHNRDYYNSEAIPPSVSPTKAPRSLMHLDRNEFGEPLLPNPLLVPSRQTSRTWRQGLVRAFLTYHYSLASGSEGSIPWKKLLPRFGECIEEDHLPANLLSLLGEPSTIKDDHCHSLLSFWYRRQTEGISPVFRFQKYLVKDELVEALPREQVDIPHTATSPIASGGNIPRTDTQPIASSSNIPLTVTPPIASGSNPAPARAKSGKRTSRAKSEKQKRAKWKAGAISSSDTPPIASGCNQVPPARAKSGKPNKGKGKARASSSDSGEATSQSTESDSNSETTTTTTTSENDSDSSTDSHSEDEQSPARIHNVSTSLNPNTADLYTRQTSYYSTSQPPLQHSDANVNPAPQADEFSGDENLFSLPIPNLGPELQGIQKMIEQGIPRQEILQAFGAMRVRSESQSPVKGHSRGVSPPTDLGKRRGRPSTEGLLPASPTKKSRLQSLKNSPEASPELQTTHLPDSLHFPDIFMNPASLTYQPSFESTGAAPEASSSTVTESRGPRARSIPDGSDPKTEGSKKKTNVPSQRVTRSKVLKRRSTRANPN